MGPRATAASALEDSTLPSTCTAAARLQHSTCHLRTWDSEGTFFSVESRLDCTRKQWHPPRQAFSLLMEQKVALQYAPRSDDDAAARGSDAVARGAATSAATRRGSLTAAAIVKRYFYAGSRA